MSAAWYGTASAWYGTAGSNVECTLIDLSATNYIRASDGHLGGLCSNVMQLL